MGDISEDNEIGYIEDNSVNNNDITTNSEIFKTSTENIKNINLKNYKYILKKEGSNYYPLTEEEFKELVKEIKNNPSYKIVYKIDKIYEMIQQDKQGNQTCIINGVCSVDCSKEPNKP